MRAYYRLVKPGIVYGNAIAGVAGFFFAAHGAFDAPLFACTIIGLMLSMAAACVFNNLIDRDIDAKMERTKARPLPTGQIPVRRALAFGTGLLVLGLSLLAFTNGYALVITAFGVFAYVLLYTPAKRSTVHSTLIGAVPGAVPPVVGYAAVADRLDTIALLLFLMLVAWQMVHFFAIAIYRKDEYAAAGLPILTVSRGVPAAKFQMLLYVLIFAFAAFALWQAARPGIIYALALTSLSLAWLALAVAGMRAADDAAWARRMFGFSLIVLLGLSLALAVS